MTRLVFGTRRSKLARRQTGLVIADLQAAWPDLEVEIKLFTTSGDEQISTPLPEIGAKGLFTAELENGLRSGEIDVAVHSCKDLPIEAAEGLTIGAITRREDARDALVSRDGQTLAGLPAGALVGTCSLRRAAQLLAARPDLKTAPIRGNVDTRLERVLSGDFDAAVLAAAGLRRLGLEHRVAEYLRFDLMLPAPAQGALAAQCRAGDAIVTGLLATVDDAESRACITAEREFLRGLGGGCTAPIAAYAWTDGEEPPTRLHMQGLVASLDGTHVVRVSGTGDDPDTLGAELAQRALAEGAGALINP